MDCEPEDDDLEAAWLDQRQQEEAARPTPEDRNAPGLIRPWPTLWTWEQVLDCDDIASYMEYVWEMTNNDEEY